MQFTKVIVTWLNRELVNMFVDVYFNVEMNDPQSSLQALWYCIPRLKYTSAIVFASPFPLYLGAARIGVALGVAPVWCASGCLLTGPPPQGASPEKGVHILCNEHIHITCINK